MNPFSFTCSQCALRGDRDLDDDWIATRKFDDGTRYYRNLTYPDRCRTCERQKKRYQRMRRRLDLLLDFSITNMLGFPKMVTISLPSKPDDSRTLEQQLAELRRKWTAFRRYYQELNLFRGGVYATESTIRINFDRDKGPWFGIKHHVHIHAVVAMKYMRPEALQAFSDSGLKFGLGRASVRGRPTNATGRSFVRHLGNYLSKYITKGHISVRSANFGKLIGYRPTPRVHAEDSASDSNDHLLTS